MEDIKNLYKAYLEVYNKNNNDVPKFKGDD